MKCTIIKNIEIFNPFAYALHKFYYENLTFLYYDCSNYLLYRTYIIS